jgi:hydrogenase expression/formation protein HypC
MRVCLAIPGQIVERSPDHPDLATVEVSRVRRVINVALLADEPLQPGDWVLIHVGFAMSLISEDAAREQLRLLAMLGEDEEAMRELDGLPATSAGTP